MSSNARPNDRLDPRKLFNPLTGICFAIFAIGCQGHQHLMRSHPQARTQVAGEYIDPNGKRHVVYKPNGWRRTKHGWEHTSAWLVNQNGRENVTYSTLLAAEEASTPTMIRPMLKRLATTSPVLIALAQICVIAIICQVARIGNQRKNSRA